LQSFNNKIKQPSVGTVFIFLEFDGRDRGMSKRVQNVLCEKFNYSYVA
jgi:hypothetical protein